MSTDFAEPSFSKAKRGFFSRYMMLAVIIAPAIAVSAIWYFYFRGDGQNPDPNSYHVAKKADFLVTVKLTGTLVATDVVTLKCELEGETTIQSIIEEGTPVKGNTSYEIQEGDTLAAIAEAQEKDALAIQILNDDLKIDWDHLPVGEEIVIPGDLLVELDPLRLRERINTQEIAVQRAENALNRSIGDLATLKLSTALSMKVAENSLENMDRELKETRESTIPNYIQNLEGQIANLEKDVILAEKNLQAYTELEKAGFVSNVEVLREESSKSKTLLNIKIARAQLEAYLKYEQVSLLNSKSLAVDEAKVNIEKTKVKNKAALSDATSTVMTGEKTLQREKDKLHDLREQMAKTKIYAPQDGTVVYWSEKWDRGAPITDGARVHRGRNLIKLPRNNSLKVDLDVPQAKRSQLKRGMKAWVQVEDVTLTGRLSILSTNVDTNRRGHTDKSYFKGEISLDDVETLPDAVSEGMSVTVEIKVVNLEGKNQLIRVPNQCVITRMISEDVSETGCWVLNQDSNNHEWRPVTIEYSDETFIAIKEETDLSRGLREGELVHLSPLTEADNLNLEEGVTSKPSLDKEDSSGNGGGKGKDDGA